ncbi:hypothetical protein BCR37DRAFT_394421 [Protomyces lactucae-debilis]|uniref:Uncharacterized protein n=1 Tax=Protomyces lactucae-debilis TaxID=2754530 RepID=A0A1Y2F5B8_PROLT|nr:uncharacterized protein BCR37DRAFT_394421 [Protomyces lactucae-debilis]ORY79082.1 hypothetical protein BCR37DRAFT_394421 [Protomyces lactucae-debilis]
MGFLILLTLALCARASQRKHFATRYWLDEEKRERKQTKASDLRHAQQRATFDRCKDLIIQRDRLYDPIIQPSYAQLQSSPRRSAHRVYATQLPLVFPFVNSPTPAPAQSPVRPINKVVSHPGAQTPVPTNVQACPETVDKQSLYSQTSSLLLPDVPTKSVLRDESGRQRPASYASAPSSPQTPRTIDAVLQQLIIEADRARVRPVSEMGRRPRPPFESRPTTRLSSCSSTSGRSEDGSHNSFISTSTLPTSNAAHENGRDAYRRNKQNRKQYRTTALETLQLVQQTISVIRADKGQVEDAMRSPSAASTDGSSRFSSDDEEDFSSELNYYSSAGFTGQRRYANYL